MTGHASSLFDRRGVLGRDYPAALVEPPPDRRLRDVADARQLRLPTGLLNCAIKGRLFCHADCI